MTSPDPEQETPLLTVIIPTYNIARYLRACLDSVVNQTYETLEIIIIDDNSTDATTGIIKDYAAADPRIKAVFHTRNHGPGNTRNEGLALATGDYVTFMDHDDWQALDKYEKMMAKAIEHDVDIVFCNAQEFDENSGKLNRHYYTLPKKGLAPNRLELIRDREKRGQLYLCLVPPWAKIVRRRLVEEHEVHFSENGNRFDDVLYHYHGCYFAKRVYFLDEILYTHRLFPESITGRAKVDRDNLFDLLDTWKELENIFIRLNIPLVEVFPLYAKILSAFMYRVENWREFAEQANSIADELGVKEEHVPETHKKAFNKLRNCGVGQYVYYRMKFRLRPYYKRIGRGVGMSR